VNPYKVLIPLDEATGPALLALAIRLLGVRRGVVLALTVVEIPQGSDVASGTAAARGARRALRRVTTGIEAGRIEIQTRVRAARTVAAGIREVADEDRPDLLLLTAAPDGSLSDTAAALIAAPPCDTVIARLGPTEEMNSVLVPARGGPAAELALTLALDLASPRGARVTLLHLDVPGTGLSERQHELRLFDALLNRSSYARLRSLTLPAADAGSALLQESARHSVTVLGASLSPQRKPDTPLGTLPHLALSQADGTVLVAMPRHPPESGIFVPQPPVDELVDLWCVENTFHCHEFADIDELVGVKAASNTRIATVITPPADADALPAILRAVHEDLSVRAGLVDEVLVIDDGSIPELADTAIAGGAAVVHPPGRGRGEAMWAGVDATTADILVFLDGDLRNPHPRFVYGLIGPLLREPRLGLVTGFHGLPNVVTDDDYADAQEQITELSIRPLLNLFFPELSGMVNPLARERAVRRDAVAGMRLPSGMGVDISMVLQMYDRGGLSSLAQCDLEERAGRREGTHETARRAFASVQALVGRLTAAKMSMPRLPHSGMKVIHREAERYHIEVVDTAEPMLPPVRHRPALVEAAAPDA
jgi:nucleotide-binding universal stress UspA family protein